MAVPKLEKHFTMRINLSPEHVYDLKSVRGPNKLIAAIAGGFIRGEGIEAEILPGGADWVSVCFLFLGDRTIFFFHSLPSLPTSHTGLVPLY